MSFSYFEHPDGEDTIRKIAFTSRYALMFGLFKSTVDVVLIDAPKGYLQTAAKVLSVTAPFVGATAIGTGVISMSTNIRQKDDPLNYVIGGVVGGLSYGLFKGKLSTALNYAAVMGLLAHAFKYNYQRGVKFDESEKVIPNDVSIWGKYHDYSSVRQPPKGWIAASD
ncbi:NADH dehydrogenase [ubiquinone] 1 alpha subcomplex subunit 11 [Nilaparvata lugens]|uniref:NADH dehydrogenase [ubiquinone] 1 alpha subcomplex subunit 11 n=1 Tax=Nilaparvata lugens TaxID=108931 RepID=UPI000B98EF86|nr:NADH dehydrogenase [ubiquinone] 1 alpha subcomplex subunit 11 [Nilaparvata lugens]